MAEPDDLNVPMIASVGAVSVILTTVVVFLVLALYQNFVTIENQRKVVNVPAANSDSKLAEQEALLARYSWKNRSEGLVTIPIERDATSDNGTSQFTNIEIKSSGDAKDRVMYFAKRLLLFMFMTAPAYGQVTTSLDALNEVGVDEQLGTDLPLGLKFRDSRGDDITLGELFLGDRPVILSLNYADCPMLCQLQLNGLVNGLRDLSWNPGEKFEIVSLSIDPLETPQRARQTKQRYLKAFGRPATAAGWHFLTGDQQSITALADAVGFRYRYVPERKEYAHAAAIMVCTPSGRVSRYLYGVEYPTQTLKLALVEASEGKIGSTLDRVLLYCFHYDAAAGRYAPVARKIMKVGAAITLVSMAVGLVPVWLRYRMVERGSHSSASGHRLRGGAA